MHATPARWVDPQEASPEPLGGFDIVVAGYGSQGQAQACNLRDSRAGKRIRVWARAEGDSATRAREEGFKLVGNDELAEADLILCLLPDERHLWFVTEIAGPSLSSSGTKASLAFAHGYSLKFSDLGEVVRRSPWIDSFLVAPCGPGAEVRRAFTAGDGVPAYCAVWQDTSGEARARAIALAHALGATRAGVLETSVSDEAVVDLFGEQSVVCGGVVALMQAAFDTLVKAGFAPEMAYMECVQQLGLTAQLIRERGIDGMRSEVSRTALFGDLTQGPRIINDQVRATMAEILCEIQSGQFARQWAEELSRETPTLTSWQRAQAGSIIEKAGRAVRKRSRRSKPVDTSEALD